MRDEIHDPNDDPEIMRNRAEAFAEGYRQCTADFIAWSNGQSSVPVEWMTVKMVENSDRYTDFAESFDRIRKAVANAEAGLTVDRGDYTQYLDSDDEQETPS